jgi:cellulose synthase/poly-beta-1,6-N-acetylglucosamine synthase-like glycosyltransferase
MDWLAYTILLVCCLALAHTYLLYPVGMVLAARGKRPHGPVYAPDDPELPALSVLMAVHNEEKVLADKLSTLFEQQYPTGKWRMYIGSDASSDDSNHIGSAFNGKEGYQYIPFQERRGKPPVINDLAAKAIADRGVDHHVLLLTDASVMLSPGVAYTLARHFKDPSIGLVDAHMKSTQVQRAGISTSERAYIGGETRLKHAESALWGAMMGPFGGCYALRADLFEPIPEKHLVDDFFLAFRVLEKGFRAINDLDAVCYEGATHRVKDEFRRKKRIAAGSFQNLALFKHWVLPPKTTLGFAFFSHKVLRWMGGFLILFGWMALGALACCNQFARPLFLVSSALLAGIPLLYAFLDRLRFPTGPIRHLSYFISMNAALIAGFFQWRKGIKDSAWQRTNRY